MIIYVLCYDEYTLNEGKKRFNKSYFRHIIIDQTYLLENIMYKKILNNLRNEWENEDYVGTISWHTDTKILNFGKNLNFEDIIKTNKEIYALSAYDQYVNEVALTDHFYHPGFKHVWVELFKKMGLTEKISTKPFLPFYFNYWICKPYIMKDYITFFNTISELINTIPEVFNDSRYTGGIPKEKLRQLFFGHPYYTLHPFIFERIPSFFTSINLLDLGIVEENIFKHNVNYVLN